MLKWSKGYVEVLSLAALGLCILIVGCADKRLAASSADASSTAKDKGAAAVETIVPERMTTVPEERRPDTASTKEDALLSSGGAMPASTVDNAGLSDIFFDFDQYAIRQDARPTLEGDAAWVSKSSAKLIVIEGHCDERGTEAYNMVLGEKRATTAKRYLEDLGIPGSKLKVVSFGKTRPFCKEHNESCYQLNRRAHFVVR
jgi:peptidoglycan-associated lipoprotein